MGFSSPIRTLTAGMLLMLALPSCEKAKPPATPAATISGPMVQRAYVWQRDWNPQVSHAVLNHAAAFDALDVLAAQVEFQIPDGTPLVIRPQIDWSAFRSSGSVGLVARVQRAGDSRKTAEIVSHSLLERLAEAEAASVRVSEFQIDYDSAQKGLADYQRWLAQVRDARIPHHDFRSGATA